MAKFKDTLKQRRSELEMSQIALAELLGVEQSTISGWESGRRKPDLLDHIKGLEEHLGIPRHLIRPDRYEPQDAVA